ncbi:hypothetical protein [Bacillus cereus]|uniref:hypothetical protein n=1 Tax=Bacillus cereus TaxID=1396 RepID=UPI000BF5AABD|nr:hypothetical protein [Bacillus cereus]PFI17439.1 hypothetical protein COI75_19725 [Bacillus cereus]
MDFSEVEQWLQWVISGITGAIAGGGLMIFYLKKRITHILDKKLAVHKSILDKGMVEYKSIVDKDLAEYNTLLTQKIEHYKSDLQMKNNIEQIKRSSLQADINVFVTDLHSKLKEVSLSVHSLLVITDETCSREYGDGKYKDLVRKINDFTSYYTNGNIYFTEEVDKVVWNVIEKVQLILIHYWTYYVDDEVERQEKLKQYIQKDFPKARKILEAEFRKLIGVTAN